MDLTERLETLSRYLKDGLENGDPTVFGIIVGILVGILTVVLLIVKSRGKGKRHGVLLLGICDAGKTLIFSQLVHNTFKQTYTSIKVNSGDYELTEKKKKLRIIDLPGHERLRGQLLEEYKSLARGLVFVVDSGTLQKEIKEVAEQLLLAPLAVAGICNIRHRNCCFQALPNVLAHMSRFTTVQQNRYVYTILSDRTVSSNTPPILILCNKQDLTLAKGVKVIRSQLEKEMNTLRVTRAAALKGVGDTANNNTYLGKRDQDFDFSHVKPLKVEFAECSALGKGQSSEGPELDALYRWLARIA